MMDQFFRLKGSILFIALISNLSILTGQVSDQINVSATFAHVIELRIENPSVQWSIQTVKEYTDGFWPVERPIPFSVASSTNYRVDYKNTQMMSAEGNEVDIRNMAYRLEPANNSVKSDFGTKYQWPAGDNGGSLGKSSLSGIFIASFSPRTILVPGPAGNAGGYDRNAFKIRIGFASPNIRAVTGMPTLLEQNIAPGTYTTILTLTAYADP